MPETILPWSAAGAAKITKAFVSDPDADGNVPAATATAAEKWAHVTRVIRHLVVMNAQLRQANEPDADLDAPTS